MSQLYPTLPRRREGISRLRESFKEVENLKKPYQMSCRDITKLVTRGQLPAVEVVSSVLERISQVEGRVHAFISIMEGEALERAKEIDKKLKEGKQVGKLAGVPVAIKDNMSTAGSRTTCGSHILENYIPPYNATVVDRLLMEDAIIIGKTNMDEFAMGTTTENSYFGPTRNPWDLKKVPGGSSGGSAAAVSAGEAILSLGSDTGGSVRCPASFCSVVGLKPTYGLVSRYGLIAYADSLEQIGPIAKDVNDCALLFSVINGYDPKDSTSNRKEKTEYISGLEESVEGMKIGVFSEFFGKGVNAYVSDIAHKSLKKLERLGASLVDILLSHLSYSLPAYYIIAMSEASSNLARYDGVRYGLYSDDEAKNWKSFYSDTRQKGFGAEVRRRIILGTYALSAGYFNEYYLKALQLRTLIKRGFEKAFETCDVIASPTMPVLPFDIGEKIDDPLSLYLCDIHTVPANLTGMPALSIPCGFSDGLPVGLQLTAPLFREDLIFNLGQVLEKSYEIPNLSPNL